MRSNSPEFSNSYAMQQQVRRHRLERPSASRAKPVKQLSLELRAIDRIHIIQMADMPRFHYEVWADFCQGGSQLLSVNYIQGLRTAVARAFEQWGVHRVELDRVRGAPHRDRLIINPRTGK